MIELATVVSILAIAAAMVVPSLLSLTQRHMLRSTARTLVTDLLRSRGLALAGRQGLNGWGPNDRTIQAGIRITDDQQYVVFVDRDRLSNGAASELILETRDLQGELQISSAVTEIRFRANGTLLNGTNDIEVMISDAEANTRKVVRVAYGGKADIVR